MMNPSTNAFKTPNRSFMTLASERNCSALGASSAENGLESACRIPSETLANGTSCGARRLALGGDGGQADRRGGAPVPRKSFLRHPRIRLRRHHPGVPRWCPPGRVQGPGRARPTVVRRRRGGAVLCSSLSPSPNEATGQPRSRLATPHDPHTPDDCRASLSADLRLYHVPFAEPI